MHDTYDAALGAATIRASGGRGRQVEDRDR